MKLLFFGPPRVQGAHNTTLRFRSRKELALLAFLAVENDSSHSRETLTGLLWPESPEDEARNNLRVILSRLRQNLKQALPAEEPCLISTRTAIQFMLTDHTWLDVAAFAAHIAAVRAHTHTDEADCVPCRQHLEQAVALYTNDFAAGLFLQDCEEYEKWLLLWRERLRADVLHALSVLARAAMASGDYSDAARYAQRQLEIDPLRELAYRQSMQALVEQREHNAALTLYDRCRRILHDELGVEPEPETQALASRVRADRASAATEVHLPAVRQAGTSQTPPSASHNLRQPLTPLIGRDDELAQLAEQLAARTYRLISIVGPGGIGKSRLALQAALQQIDAFRDGVYFVSLARLQAAVDLPAAIADALSLPLSGEQAPQTQLLAMLRQREMLLVLDNLEHLLEAVPLLLDILQQAPAMVLLVTSRERLHVQAENLFRLDGLAVPPIVPGPAATDHAAMHLFVDRAARIQKDFQLTAENIAAVGQICRMVEGMPLGIELAATWVSEFTCAEIAAELQHGLDILTTTLRDVPPHQRSIRSVFEYSWALLSAEERTILAQLSVFRGGFTRQAAQEIVGAAPLLLTQLLHKSLLRHAGSGRFDMHELLRQFAAEKLAGWDEQHIAATRTSHSHYYLGLVSDQAEALQRSAARTAATLISADLDNVRCGWELAVAGADPALLSRSYVGLSRFYELTGLLQEGATVFQHAAGAVRPHCDTERNPFHRKLLCSLLITEAHFWAKLKQFAASLATLQEALGLADDEQHIQICINRGFVLALMADYQQAAEQLQHSLTCARSEHLPALEARALLELGFVNLQQGQYERAEAQLRQAQDYYHRMDNQFYLADIYFQLSAVAAEQNEVSVSFDYLKQMQQSVEKIGDRKGAGLAAHMLSNIYNPLGMYAEAIQASRQARQIAQEIGDTEFESFVLHMLCDSYRCVGSFDQASECGQQSLILARAHKSPLAIISAHHYLAILAMDNDELELARAHCLDAYALYQELDHKIGVVGILAVLAAVTLQLGRKVEAVAIVDDILARLDGKPVVGVDHPLRVYWYCYRVLRAASDARARDVLSSGYALMQTIAASITDPAMCRVFRDGVAVHRALAAAWHATQAAVADAAPMPSVYHNGANGSLMNNTIDE